MKRSTPGILFILLAIIMLHGCGAKQLLVQGEPAGKIRINNYSDYAIGTVGIDNCDSFFAGQGGNRLPEGVHIGAKSYYEFDVNTGCWDLLLYTYSSSVPNGPTGSGATGVVNGKVNVSAGETAIFNIGAEVKVLKKW